LSRRRRGRHAIPTATGSQHNSTIASPPRQSTRFSPFRWSGKKPPVDCGIHLTITAHLGIVVQIVEQNEFAREGVMILIRDASRSI